VKREKIFFFKKNLEIKKKSLILHSLFERKIDEEIGREE